MLQGSQHSQRSSAGPTESLKNLVCADSGKRTSVIVPCWRLKLPISQKVVVNLVSLSISDAIQYELVRKCFQAGDISVGVAHGLRKAAEFGRTAWHGCSR
eukprot:752687-Hanusia_phi.AAC.1